MVNRKTLAIGGLCLALVGCSVEPTMEMKTSRTPVQPQVEFNQRYQVTRVGVFADDIAYNSRRGIYEIVDTETGKEYFGVSGVGITEISSHVVSTGKTVYNVEDER